MIVLYSTGCPKCKVLESKLDKKNISYVTTDDVTAMLNKGIKSVPQLEVDGQLLDFAQAVQWVNSKEAQP